MKLDKFVAVSESVCFCFCFWLFVVEFVPFSHVSTLTGSFCPSSIMPVLELSTYPLQPPSQGLNMCFFSLFCFSVCARLRSAFSFAHSIRPAHADSIEFETCKSASHSKFVFSSFFFFFFHISSFLFLFKTKAKAKARVHLKTEKKKEKWMNDEKKKTTRLEEMNFFLFFFFYNFFPFLLLYFFRGKGGKSCLW